MQENEMPERIRQYGGPRVLVKWIMMPPRIRLLHPSVMLLDSNECVIFLPEDLELLKLVDLNGLEQEKTSAIIGVSRSTVWKDLHEARRKVADAFMNRKKIEIAGCEHRIEGRCPREGEGCSTGSQDELCRRWHQQRNHENQK